MMSEGKSEHMVDGMIESRYLSAGANRYTAAADWAEDGLVAFGSDSNVCLWDPTDPRGISHILSGHTAHVRAVAFLSGRNEEGKTVNLVTGGDDKQLRLWAIDSETGTASCVQTVQEHSEPINCIAALKRPASEDVARQIFATGAADATVKIWVFKAGQITLLQTIKTTRKYMPLTLALSALEGNGLVLAVAGTTNAVQIFTASAADGSSGAEFTLQATLPGHENWIRSLDFIREKPEKGSDILLASASQDKYIRLWRIHQGTALSALNAAGLGLSADALTPGNKAHKITAGDTEYCIVFEALLLGHEDWVYSARWFRATDGRLQLLSASADNTLSLWESDTESGIWITVVRLGEISREKGATTATGSIGGFWTGLWSPTGTTVITLGRTGSWRRWDYDAAEDMWKQNFAISGHTRAVTGVSWSRDGLYLLSTSSDQTTRLHAEWALDARNSWHEMSRPQIHGYDLNCISALGPASFVSGADEKLMRVFTEPKAVARMLSHLTNTAPPAPETEEALPDVANMPVLGLSNKAVTTHPPEGDHLPAGDLSNQTIDPTTAGPDTATTHTQPSPLSTLTHPPLEESLSRHTLWPEIEKLYGHGYEISCLAASHDGTLVASACRASSLTHAVIRLFETRGWTELRPPLQAHTLTVARVRFSRDDRYILSVGRDRGWAVWERTVAGEGRDEGEGDGGYKLAQANAKGHTRMVLDAAWAPVGDDANGTRVFATAGRDKLVKVWVRKGGEGGQFELGKVVTEEHPVTALDFVPEVTEEGLLVLAVGTEGGKVSVLTLKVNDGEVEVVSTLVVDQALSLPKAVLQLAWRPTREGRKGRELAIAGEDGSLRIYSFLAL
ncbi:WD40-repeat-containing domain protein [Chaetomium tenue]|uniref:WD40-repeat-containing domain protein n=1 Tax=Chaetomium tenue TaxID=1854479 RepID=A0ACB7PKL8_9PEZI|nr:WD40-repeat-containing domain protein [Chaetomium globosum]